MGANTIRLTAHYLTNHTSNFSFNENGRESTTDLTLSFMCRILRSTTATASPAPVTSNTIPSGALLFVRFVVLRFKMTETEILPKNLSPWRQCSIKI